MINLLWQYSIRTKLIVGFGCVITIVIIGSVWIYQKASELTRQKTYEKMQSQAEYYMQSLDNELSHIRQLQMDFFNDRMLATSDRALLRNVKCSRKQKRDIRQ